jgi:hypothetical protein
VTVRRLDSLDALGMPASSAERGSSIIEFLDFDRRNRRVDLPHQIRRFHVTRNASQLAANGRSRGSSRSRGAAPRRTAGNPRTAGNQSQLARPCHAAPLRRAAATHVTGCHTGLVLRSGSSPASLGLLQAALASPNSTIRELEFVGLSSLAELTGALVCCCHGGKIRRLRLENYRLPTRPSSRQQEAVARSICHHVLGEAHISDSTKDNRETPVALKTLEIVGVPLGTVGAHVLTEAVAHNQTLEVLKLMDCNLRSDSATSVAETIRRNQSLIALDLSYNPHLLGSPLTQEMTLKTLVRRGLTFNLTMRHVVLPQTGGIIRDGPMKRQLDVSRFRQDFVTKKRNVFDIPPPVWPHLLARVSAKPSALHLFLLESVVSLFE